MRPALCLGPHGPAAAASTSDTAAVCARQPRGGRAATVAAAERRWAPRSKEKTSWRSKSAWGGAATAAAAAAGAGLAEGDEAHGDRSGGWERRDAEGGGGGGGGHALDFAWNEEVFGVASGGRKARVPDGVAAAEAAMAATAASSADAAAALGGCTHQYSPRHALHYNTNPRVVSIDSPHFVSSTSTSNFITYCGHPGFRGESLSSYDMASLTHRALPLGRSAPTRRRYPRFPSASFNSTAAAQATTNATDPKAWKPISPPTPAPAPPTIDIDVEAQVRPGGVVGPGRYFPLCH